MFRKSGMTACLLAIFFGMIFFMNQANMLEQQYEMCRKEYRVLRERINADSPEDIDIEYWNILRRVNPDYAGWIRMEGTKIDYPVVQAGQSEFYLTHIFSGEEGVSGTLFFRQQGDLKDEDNLIVFGHNMRDGSMFGNLKAYAETVLKEAHAITLNLNGKWYSYRTIAAYAVDADESWPYVCIFSSAFSRHQYLERITRLSAVEYPEVEFTDSPLITLSTCAGNKRFLIAAVREK